MFKVMALGSFYLSFYPPKSQQLLTITYYLLTLQFILYLFFVFVKYKYPYYFYSILGITLYIFCTYNTGSLGV